MTGGNMKRVFYKTSLVFVAIVIGLVIFIRFFVKDVYFFRMTEGEAVKILFHYINFGCDDDYDSIVTSAVVQGQVVYLYQTPEQKNNQHEMLQCKQLTDDERYYIFSHYTQYETDALSCGYYYEYHTDYAVNRETGEILLERQWLKKGESYEVIYNKEYEKEIIQKYFNEDISDGKMSEEEAAETLFYYLYSADGYDYDLMVARTIQQKQSVYVYQLPEELPCIKQFRCKGLTDDKLHYVFAHYTACYTYSYGPMFICNQYSMSYAVNRETGEVIPEREWSVKEAEWLYREEYEKVVNQ